ncbi:peptidoglycan editing factor PgeF [Evansella halocellulosilytica]|uniref:peptidoglycan editing factor PgeF n=1 Tax=Evansella halocellulosilytica TaxID=2011013 RepID=UPI000BB99EC2|nr:peptidoglycan editing factor PgeF [Evansella halocellulosilytica]
MTTEPFSEKHKHALFMNKWTSLNNEVIAGFTTKQGGFSNAPFTSFNLGLHVNDDQSSVVKNRELLADQLGFSTARWTCADQTHDNHIAKVSIDDTGKGVFNYDEALPATDGLYTREKNVLLTLCFADCVPIYFIEPVEKIIGVAHAGWKGSVKDIAGEMIRTWKEHEGVDSDNIITAIGPSIGACCYVVDDYVIGFVNEALQTEQNVPYEQISEGQYALDLKKLNRALLIKAGIPAENIEVSSYCTSCEDTLFFSHRRDKGKTGRMLSFIGLKEQ